MVRTFEHKRTLRVLEWQETNIGHVPPRGLSPRSLPLQGRANKSFCVRPRRGGPKMTSIVLPGEI